MIWLLFIGDMVVMAGMAAVATWLFTREDGRDTAAIPLHDELSDQMEDDTHA